MFLEKLLLQQLRNAGWKIWIKIKSRNVWGVSVNFYNVPQCLSSRFNMQINSLYQDWVFKIKKFNSGCISLSPANLLIVFCIILSAWNILKIRLRHVIFHLLQKQIQVFVLPQKFFLFYQFSLVGCYKLM